MKVTKAGSSFYAVEVGLRDVIVYTVSRAVETPGRGWFYSCKYEYGYRPSLKSCLSYLKQQHIAAVLAESSVPSYLKTLPTHAPLSGKASFY